MKNYFNTQNLKKLHQSIRQEGLLITMSKIYRKIKIKINPKLETKIEVKQVVFLKNFKNYQQVDVKQLQLKNPVDLIIPIYNGYEFLEPLFLSIQHHTSATHRLIIINDASPDSRIAIFLEDIQKYKNKFCQELILIQNAENLGFVKTINHALRYIKNNFVILNTDIELPSAWLQRLMHPIESDPTIASTTPFTNAGTLCSFPNWFEDNLLVFQKSVEQIDAYFKTIDPRWNIIIPTGVGFCIGMNKAVVDQIGLFDELFGKGYGEENDWCMRAIQAGYKNIQVANLFVWHKHAASFGEMKKKLILENEQKLNFKHPNYNQIVDQFIQKNPLEELRDAVFFQMSCHHITQIIFDHYLGGGTTKFMNEKLLRQGIYSFCIFGQPGTTAVFVILYQGIEKLKQWTLKDLKEIFEFARFDHLKEIHVNHLLTLMKERHHILKFLTNTKAQKYYYQHDFSNICPIYTLINSKGVFCEIPEDLKVCFECQKHNINSSEYQKTDLSLMEWRTYYHQLLSLMDAIFCFSNDSKQHLLTVHSHIASKIVIKPHTISLEKVIKKIDFTKKNQINIGVLGAINYQKGAVILDELTQINVFQQGLFKITIVGEMDQTYVKNNGIIITGKYTSEDLRYLLQNQQIDLFIVPSICPETFCYTAEEIMHLGYPIIVFPLGAPPERVSTYEHGFIAQEISAESMWLKIVEVVQKYGFKINI